MSFYKVRPGQSFGQNDGEQSIERKGGEVVELDDRIARELAHKVDPSDEQGNLLVPNDDGSPQVDHLLQGSQPHERVSLLTTEREKVAAQLEALDARIADEQKAEDERVAAVREAEEKTATASIDKDIAAGDSPARDNNPGAKPEPEPAAPETPTTSAATGPKSPRAPRGVAELKTQ